ncbi:uncharacterized protein LOC110872915 isoform X4 [Helianthus annuus]|uniref:uncharacterized protein LOC110872915 isoform X4 n=1 Tax=Helianthus annuus TaxID=4232 RepID=UPI000B8FF7BE|nr:uncharacterized protein LOC110872915 isoform X4 [Helianthus annuus]
MLGCLSQGIVEPVEKLKGRSRSQSPMPRSIHVMVFTVKHSLETSHTNLKCLQSFGLAVPPEQLYATQLSQLQEIGFFDTQENIRALRATAGNVHAAVERLLGNFGP